MGVWLNEIARAGERVQLRSIGCDFMIDDVYRDLPTGTPSVSG